jgi:hypothetical protein
VSGLLSTLRLAVPVEAAENRHRQAAAAGVPTAWQATWEWKASIYATENKVPLEGLDLADPARLKPGRSEIRSRPGDYAVRDCRARSERLFYAQGQIATHPTAPMQRGQVRWLRARFVSSPGEQALRGAPQAEELLDQRIAARVRHHPRDESSRGYPLCLGALPESPATLSV